MITLFVTLVVVILLMAMVGYSVFSFQRSSELVAMVQRNSSHMEGVVALMRASMRYSTDSNQYMIPMGVMSDRMRLPTWVVGDDHTPWGGQYAYCPLAPRVDGAAATAVVGGVGSASSYAVTLSSVNDSTGVARGYVWGYNWGSRPSSLTADVIGLIISPAPMQTAAPDCADVVYSNGYFTISPSASVPGSVSAISMAGVVNNASMSQNTDTVLWVAPSGLGSGTGTDSADAMPFSQALDYWQSVHPKGATFNFATAGVYSMTAAESNFVLGSPVGAPSVSAGRAFIYFVPPPTGTAVLKGVGGAALPLNFGVNAEFSGSGGGITLDSQVTMDVLPNTQVAASLVSMGTAVVDGGVLTLSSGSVSSVLVRQGEARIFPSSLSALEVDGGVARVYASGALSSALTLNGGELFLQSAGSAENVNMSASFGGGSLVVGSGINLNFSSVTFQEGKSSPFRLTLQGSSTLTDTIGGGITTYASLKDFLDNRATVSVTQASACAADGSADCTASCTTANPYVVSGQCLPVTGTVLAGFSETEGAWTCRYRTLTSLGTSYVQGTTADGVPSGVVQTSNLDDGTLGGYQSVTGGAVAKCSAVPR